MRGPLLAAAAALTLTGCITVFAVSAPDQAVPTPVPSGATTAPVRIQLDASRSVTRVTATLTDSATNTTRTLSLTPGAASTYQNSQGWTTTETLGPGRYTFAATGTTSGSSPQTARVNATFRVAAPSYTLTLARASGTGAVLVPRGGSAPLPLVVTLLSSTSPVTVSVGTRPTGRVATPATQTVTPGGTPATVTLTLNVPALADTRGRLALTARSTGVPDASLGVDVRAVPAPGSIAWQPVPVLGPAGPPTPMSPDGRYVVTTAQQGTSRFSDITIARTANPTQQLTLTLGIVPASSGSVPGGVLFCGTAPTTAAVIFDDPDRSPAPAGGVLQTNYRAQLVLLDGGVPRIVGQIDGVRIGASVLAQIGFSPDCSIVGLWWQSATLASERVVTFSDVLVPGVTPTLTVSSAATTAAASLAAAIAGDSINVTPTGGISQRLPLP